MGNCVIQATAGTFYQAAREISHSRSDGQDFLCVFLKAVAHIISLKSATKLRVGRNQGKICSYYQKI